jgi:hypothetical protein
MDSCAAPVAPVCTARETGSWTIANFEHARQLVNQLNHAELRTHCAVSWSAA